MGFAGNIGSKLPAACGVEARMWAVVSLKWLPSTIFLTSLRLTCFICVLTRTIKPSSQGCFEDFILMLLAQSLRVWSSLNVCSLFAITVPESERLWWWQRLFVFRQNLQLPENCLERDRNSGDKRSHFVASPHAQRSTHTALSSFP